MTTGTKPVLREKAIRTLAELFEILRAEGYGLARGEHRPEPERGKKLAADYLDRLSLVAIDLALVEAVKAADLKHAQFSMEHVARGEVYTDWEDAECGRDRARVDLADHVLAQLGGTDG